MYTKEKTVEKCVCSRTELNKCTQYVHGRRTQNNTVQFAEEEEEPPVNIAYGLYVLVHLRRYIQIRILTMILTATSKYRR